KRESLRLTRTSNSITDASQTSPNPSPDTDRKRLLNRSTEVDMRTALLKKRASSSAGNRKDEVLLEVKLRRIENTSSESPHRFSRSLSAKGRARALAWTKRRRTSDSFSVDE